MELTRRRMLAIGSGTLVLAGTAGLPAYATPTDDAIAALTGGADLGEGGVTISAPEIAENGNTVPIEVAAPGATMITLFADGNPVPVPPLNLETQEQKLRFHKAAIRKKLRKQAEEEEKRQESMEF